VLSTEGVGTTSLGLEGGVKRNIAGLDSDIAALFDCGEEKSQTCY
jgi:hypothetical protein